MKRNSSFHVTEATTYVQCEVNEEDTKERIHTSDEYVIHFLTMTKEVGGVEVFPFKDIYFNYGTPKLLDCWNDGFSKKMCDIGIEIITMNTLDEVFMNSYIKGAILNCFQLNHSFLEGPIESFPREALKLG
jgi:hypothetical protein